MNEWMKNFKKKWRGKNHVISNTSMGHPHGPPHGPPHGRPKQASPIWALVVNSKVCRLISKGPKTCSPKNGHWANMRKMESQRLSQYCQHSYTCVFCLSSPDVCSYLEVRNTFSHFKDKELWSRKLKWSKYFVTICITWLA